MRVFAIAVAMILCVWSADSRATDYGPYGCAACNLSPTGILQSVPTDQAAQSMLQALLNGNYHIGAGLVPVTINVGDRVVICDPNFCVEYEYTSPSGFVGRESTPNILNYNQTYGGGPTGSGGSSTGGGFWSGGGTNLGGGGCSRCIGTVHTGALRTY